MSGENLRALEAHIEKLSGDKPVETKSKLDEYRAKTGDAYSDLTDEEILRVKWKRDYSDVPFEDYVQVMTAQAEVPPTGSMPDYVADSMKSEAGRMAESVIPNSILPYLTGGEVDPYQEMREYYNAPKEERPSQQELAMMEAARGDTIARQRLGHEGLVPEGSGQKYAGMVGRAMVDPMAMVGAKLPGNIAAKGVEKGAKLAGSLALEYGHSAASALAGMAAGEAVLEPSEKEDGLYTPYSYLMSELIAPVAGGFVGVARNTGRTAASAIKLGWRKGKTTTVPVLDENGQTVMGPDGDIVTREVRLGVGSLTQGATKIQDFINTAEVQRVMQQAAEAGRGDLAQRIKTAIEIEAQLPGISFPTAFVGADNPVIAKNFGYLYGKYPEFRARVDKAQKEGLRQLKAHMAKVGGDDPIFENRMRDDVARHAEDEQQKLLSTYEKRREMLEGRQYELSRRLIDGDADEVVGRKADALLAAEEEVARAVLRPQYNKLFEEAEAEGVTLPAASVKHVWDTVNRAKAEDIFSIIPGVSAKVLSHWKPQEVEGGKIILLGQPQQKTVKAHQAVQLHEVDSLKRAINKALRVTKDETRRFQLMTVKNALNDVIDGNPKANIPALPGKFPEQYRAIDADYIKLVAPFTTEGAKSMDRAKFYVEVSNKLSKMEIAQDFLRATGPEGIPLVRSAVLLQLERSLRTTGEPLTPATLLNQANALQRMIMDKRLRGTIDLVPGLEKELSDVTTGLQAVARNRQKIDSDYNAAALAYTENFYKAIEGDELINIAQTIMKSRKSRGKYLASIKNMPPELRDTIMSGLKQSVLHNAQNSKMTMIDYVKEHNAAFTDLFGPQYLPMLKTIARAHGYMKSVDTEKRALALDFKDQDQFKQRTGVGLAQGLGYLRNQILSWKRKMINMGTLMFEHKGALKRDKQMMDLLMNKDALTELHRAAVTLEGASAVPSKLAGAGRAYLNAWWVYVARGAAMGGVGYNELLEQEYLDGTLGPKWSPPLQGAANAQSQRLPAQQ